MTTLFLIRHATTEFNENQLLNGRENSRLSARGLVQIDCLQTRFSKVPLDAIYCSPLDRARQTAQAVAGGREIPIIDQAFLIEREMGSMSGKHVTEIDATLPAEQLHYFHHDPKQYTFGGAETADAVFARMKKGMRTLIAGHPDQTIAVVSHYFALRVYLEHELGGQLSEKFTRPNASVSQLLYPSPSEPKLVFIGDVSHIPEPYQFQI